MKVLALGARSIQILCWLVLFPFVMPDAAVGAEASYLTFLVPGALGTFPMSMNSSMIVMGYYTRSPSTASAFIRDAAGTITTFDIRGGLWTEPESINDSGDITGFYEVVAGVQQSFVRYANGRVVTFNPSVKNCMYAPSESLPVAINNFGEIAGNYSGACVFSVGFTRYRAGGFDYNLIENHTGSDYPEGTMGLNANGAVVGYATQSGVYTDASGFLLHPDGYVTGFEVPLSGPIADEATIPEAINDAGVIAGWYSFCPRSTGIACGGEVNRLNTGGFVRSPQGAFTTFNPPGTLVAPVLATAFDGKTLWSAPKSLSLNASGVVAGTYTDATGKRHGFVRNPYGTITPFEPPRGMETTVTSINDSGVIAGTFYYDWDPQTSIGFLRIPAP